MQGGDADEGGILPCIYHRPARSFACGFFVTVGGAICSVGMGLRYFFAGTTFHGKPKLEIPAEYGLPLCGWAWRGVPAMALWVGALPAWAAAIGIVVEGE